MNLVYKELEVKEEKPSRIQPLYKVFVPEWGTTVYLFSKDAYEAFILRKGMK